MKPNNNQNHDKILSVAIQDIIKKSIVDGSDKLIQLPEQKIYLSPFLAEGFHTSIYSKPKEGKSFLGLLLAISITHGLNIGKWEFKNYADCLYINGNMDGHILQERYNKMILNLPNPKAKVKFLSSSDTCKSYGTLINIYDDYWRKQIEEFLWKNPKIKILIFDNISGLTNLPEESSNIAKDDLRNRFAWLKYGGYSVVTLEGATKEGVHWGLIDAEENVDFLIKVSKDSVSAKKLVIDIKFELNRLAPDVYFDPFKLIIKNSGDGITWDIK